MIHKAVFTTNDNQYAYIGYTQGERWKHYDVPYFEKGVALKIAEEFNVVSDQPIEYDEEYDNFFFVDEANNEVEIYKGKEFITAEGIKTFYPIKGWHWQWEEFTEGNINTLAEGIADWLLEFDTYEFRDQYDDEIEVVKEIKCQLRELQTLEQAIRLYYNEVLSAEEKFNGLKTVIKL